MVESISFHHAGIYFPNFPRQLKSDISHERSYIRIFPWNFDPPRAPPRGKGSTFKFYISRAFWGSSTMILAFCWKTCIVTFLGFSFENLKITVNMNRTGSEKDFPDLGVDHPRKLGWVKPSVWKVLLSGPSTVYTIPSFWAFQQRNFLSKRWWNLSLSNPRDFTFQTFQAH